MSTVDVAEKVDIRRVLCVLVEMCDLYEQDMFRQKDHDIVLRNVSLN